MLKRKLQQQQQLQQPQLPEREETGDEEDGSRIGEDPRKSVQIPVGRSEVLRPKRCGGGGSSERSQGAILARVWRAFPDGSLKEFSYLNLQL